MDALSTKYPFFDVFGCATTNRKIEKERLLIWLFLDLVPIVAQIAAVAMVVAASLEAYQLRTMSGSELTALRGNHPNFDLDDEATRYKYLIARGVIQFFQPLMFIIDIIATLAALCILK